METVKTIINNGMANPFENISTAAGDQDRSFNWYMRSVKKVATGIKSFSDATRTDLGELTSNIEPGKMYMFVYDPKLKNSLPYYDTFPLCLPFEKVTGGFIGLNLHYLGPMQRAKLLGELIQFTEKDRMDISWSLLKNFTRFPQVKPSIKRYLTSNVNSRFLEVTPDHWKASIFLPTQNFVGASDRTVYTDSNQAMQ